MASNFKYSLVTNHRLKNADAPVSFINKFKFFCIISPKGFASFDRERSESEFIVNYQDIRESNSFNLSLSYHSLWIMSKKSK